MWWCAVFGEGEGQLNPETLTGAEQLASDH